MDTALFPPTENASGDALLLAMLAHGDCYITRKESGCYVVRADKVSAMLASTQNEYGTTWWLVNVRIEGAPYTASYHLDNAELPGRVRSMHQQQLRTASSTVMQHAMAILSGKEVAHD